MIVLLVCVCVLSASPPPGCHHSVSELGLAVMEDPYTIVYLARVSEVLCACTLEHLLLHVMASDPKKRFYRMQLVFQVTSGDCTAYTSHATSCVHSPGYPSVPYPPYCKCEVAAPALPIHVASFETEAGYDRVCAACTRTND